MFRLGLVVAAMLAASGAWAQGAFCQSGNDAIDAHKSRGSGPPPPSLVYDNCAPGDTVIVPSLFLGFVGEVCDMTKPTLTIRESVVCSVSQRKPVKSRR